MAIMMPRLSALREGGAASEQSHRPVETVEVTRGDIARPGATGKSSHAPKLKSSPKPWNRVRLGIDGDWAAGPVLVELDRRSSSPVREARHAAGGPLEESSRRP
jgi:hypothetical protein